MNSLWESVDKELEKLTRENKVLKEERDGLGERLNIQDKVIKELFSALRSFDVDAIYYHKQRGNTTVKFKDGSSITVHLKKGDKNCLETAIAWALMKHNYNINGLMKIVQKVGE